MHCSLELAFHLNNGHWTRFPLSMNLYDQLILQEGFSPKERLPTSPRLASKEGLPTKKRISSSQVNPTSLTFNMDLCSWPHSQGRGPQ